MKKKETDIFQVHGLTLKTYHLINNYLNTQGFTTEIWSTRNNGGDGWSNVRIKRK